MLPQPVRREYEPFMPNGDAHHTEAEELRIRPVALVFKDWNGREYTMTLTILHVEDHKVVADAVREALQLEGWRVTTCFDGAVALTKLAKDTPYDLLIIDNHLPNVNGIEVVRYARRLPHRRRTPIIMLSAAASEAEALEAGVDVFLEKPDGMGLLVETIESLAGAN